MSDIESQFQNSAATPSGVCSNKRKIVAGVGVAALTAVVVVGCCFGFAPKEDADVTLVKRLMFEGKIGGRLIKVQPDEPQHQLVYSETLLRDEVYSADLWTEGVDLPTLLKRDGGYKAFCDAKHPDEKVNAEVVETPAHKDCMNAKDEAEGKLFKKVVDSFENFEVINGFFVYHVLQIVPQSAQLSLHFNSVLKLMQDVVAATQSTIAEDKWDLKHAEAQRCLKDEEGKTLSPEAKEKCEKVSTDFKIVLAFYKKLVPEAKKGFEAITVAEDLSKLTEEEKAEDIKKFNTRKLLREIIDDPDFDPVRFAKIDRYFSKVAPTPTPA